MIKTIGLMETMHVYTLSIIFHSLAVPPMTLGSGSGVDGSRYEHRNKDFDGMDICNNEMIIMIML